MAAYTNLSIDQGTDYSGVISVTASDGTAFNLTGFTARGQIRKTYTSLTSVAFTVAVQSASEGTLLLTLSRTTSASMKAGRYLYDIEIVNTGTGSVARVVEGMIEINARITQL